MLDLLLGRGEATAASPKYSRVEDFAAEADRHPMFELIPAGEGRSTGS